MWRPGPEQAVIKAFSELRGNVTTAGVVQNYGLTLPENKPRVVPPHWGLPSCRWLHLPFTSHRRNKWLPKSLTHEKISGC